MVGISEANFYTILVGFDEVKAKLNIIGPIRYEMLCKRKSSIPLTPWSKRMNTNNFVALRVFQRVGSTNVLWM